MKYDNERITAIGIRLKAEAKKRGLKNQDIADLIGYSSEKQISPIYSGKKTISDTQAEILANKWKIRKEYILCIDDWKTEEEMLQGLAIDDINAFNTCRAYLKTLGYTLSPYIYIKIPASTVLQKWNVLIDYVPPAVADKIMNMPYFDSPKDFYLNYFGKDLAIEIKKPLNDINISFTEIGKTTGHKDYFLKSVSDDDNMFGVNYDYLYGFKLSYNGEYLHCYSISSIQALFRNIDVYVKCTVDNYVKTHGYNSIEKIATLFEE